MLYLIMIGCHSDLQMNPTKGLRTNNFTELAPRFRLDVGAPIEQNHRNSSTISRILRLKSNQKWSEDGMPKCAVIFA